MTAFSTFRWKQRNIWKRKIWFWNALFVNDFQRLHFSDARKCASII